jgi:tetratricopeptide (TPR) repeat protein
MLAHHYGAALEFARASGQETSGLEESARLAFRDAGERSLALGALQAARSFFAQALRLWPEADPDWPYLALRHAQAGIAVQQGGEHPLAVRALERFLAAGDLEHAAEAEALLAEADWFAGRSDSTFARLEHARRLVADRPASAAKTKTYAELSRFMMLANRNEEAVEVGRATLALARELGLRDLQAHALNNVGTARTNLGDLGGFEDLEEAFAIADAINSPEALRALGNHASLVADHGDLRRSRELYEQVVELSRRLGIRGFDLWCQVELAFLDYQAGAWDSALERIEAFLAAMGEGHYIETLARQVRAEIMVARGDVEGGRAESDRAVAFSRSAKDPQTLYPGLAVNARIHALAGHTVEAGERADELVALSEGSEFHANQWAVHFAFALDELGRSADAAALVAGLATPTPWRDVAAVYAAGDRVGAADLLGELGDLADEAYARLRAAEEGEGQEQLNQALAFFRSVNATALVRRAEALLPATA